MRAQTQAQAQAQAQMKIYEQQMQAQTKIYEQVAQMQQQQAQAQPPPQLNRFQSYDNGTVSEQQLRELIMSSRERANVSRNGPMGRIPPLAVYV